MSSKSEKRVKKLVLVLITYTSVIATRKEVVEITKTAETVETTRTEENGEENKGGRYPENLIQVLCIQYPITFRKKFVPLLTLFDTSSEVKVNHLTFAQELGLFIRLIDVGVQKIDNTTLDTYEMVIITFSITDKANRVKFFEKIFLVANISLEIIFGMLFFTLNRANIDFFRLETPIENLYY